MLYLTYNYFLQTGLSDSQIQTMRIEIKSKSLNICFANTNSLVQSLVYLNSSLAVLLHIVLRQEKFLNTKIKQYQILAPLNFLMSIFYVFFLVVWYVTVIFRHNFEKIHNPHIYLDVLSAHSADIDSSSYNRRN